MRVKWMLLILASIAAITLTAACGGGDDDGSSNPGGLTADEASDLAKEIIAANDCDGPSGPFSTVEVAGDKWELVASIGLKSYRWTLDPAAGTVSEASGVCQT